MNDYIIYLINHNVFLSLGDIIFEDKAFYNSTIICSVVLPN